MKNQYETSGMDIEYPEIFKAVCEISEA